MKLMRILQVLLVFVFVTGCAGMSIFPPPVEPYCTPEEQESSLIYKNFDPQTADFALTLGVAAYLDKYPGRLEEIEEAYAALEKAAITGLTYDAFFVLVREKLGNLTYVVVSKFVSQFKGIKIPINECDQRLILGHIKNQTDLFKLIK